MNRGQQCYYGVMKQGIVFPMYVTYTNTVCQGEYTKIDSPADPTSQLCSYYVAATRELWFVDMNTEEGVGEHDVYDQKLY